MEEERTQKVLKTSGGESDGRKRDIFYYGTI